MLKQRIKELLQPLRLLPRRWLKLPTLDEQYFGSTRGCLYTACLFCNRNYVAGDYLEFGVWQGNSFIKAYDYLLQFRTEHMAWLTHRPGSETRKVSPEHQAWKTWNQRFLAFDSFEGLPEPTGRQVAEEWIKGEYACSEQQFKRNLHDAGVDLSRVITVPGFYDNTLNADTTKKLGLSRAAIVHIDCDLYESTACALDFVTDLLIQGSVLVFDDWFYNQGRRDLGEQRAFFEWQQRNPQLELVEYWRSVMSNSFIVNLRKNGR